jgi:hypothetical protein
MSPNQAAFCILLAKSRPESTIFAQFALSFVSSTPREQAARHGSDTVQHRFRGLLENVTSLAASRLELAFIEPHL